MGCHKTTNTHKNVNLINYCCKEKYHKCIVEG